MSDDELPTLADEREVEPAIIEQFHADGHTVIRQLASHTEIEALRPALERAAATFNRETKPIAERHTYGKAFLQTNNLWKVDPVAKRFVFARRFASVAAALLGCEGVRLYHDKALFKEPGGGPTPWHQDQFYWPFEPVETVTMWMALRPIESVPGSMTFASGSHRFGAVSDDPRAEATDAEMTELIEARSLTCVTHGALAAGDATFHTGWTLHRADPNPTGAMRPVMTVVYVPDGTRVAKPANVIQEFERQRWLRGTPVGEPVASVDNPRLYP